MRNIIILLFASLLLASCAGSKALELGQTQQGACTNQTTLTDQREYIGETVDNFTIYQQGTVVTATMDVRTRCTATLSFTPEVSKGKLVLRLANTNPQISTCVCVTRVTVPISNLEKGVYSVLVMAPGGNSLLAQQTLTVN